MKKITLNTVKVEEVYMIEAVVDGGAGSGSQSFYTTIGKIKEVNAEFIRVYTGVSKQSRKIKNNDIIRVYLAS